MQANPLSPIERAIRNAHILNWLRDCDTSFHAALAARYASHLQCPVCEVDTREDTSIDWLWWVDTHYGAVIALWVDDQL